MFSVPGWSITAPLKTQTEPVKVPTLASINGTSKTGDGASKKRKRKEKDGEEAKEGKVKKVKAGEEKKEGKDLGKVEKKKKDSEKSEKKNEKVKDKDGKVEKKDKKEKREKKDKSRRDEHTNGSTGEGAASVEKKAKKGKKEKEELAQDDVQPAADEKDKKSNKKEKKKAKETTSSEKSALESSTGKAKATKQKDEAPKSKHDPQPTKVSPANKNLTPLQSAMTAKLSSARFRSLNETLYTSASDKALEMFKDPNIFEAYHSGFRQQVNVWPQNPVDGYIADIKRRGAVKTGNKGSTKEAKPLPRTQGTCTIADLGCGDANLAGQLQKSQEKLHVKVLSYDLHSPSPLVTRADIANLPLEEGSVNVAIFCLALMGTNWPDFIDEAYRILHWKGELWVAEIKSRFGRVDKKSGPGKVVEHSVGNRKKKPRSKMSEAEKRREDDARKDEDETLAVEVDGVSGEAANGNDETDVSVFIKVLASRGFVLDEDAEVERGNKMFVKMRFLKAAQPVKGKNVKKGAEGATWKPKGKKFLDGAKEEIDEEKVLKPCVYKLR